MLRISGEQFQFLEMAQRDRFVDDCVRALRADYPDAATSGPDLRERARLLIEQLSGLGFAHTGDCMYAVQLVFRYQQEHHRGPMPASIVAKLRSAHVTTEKKIEALEQLFIFGAHPGRDIADRALRER